MVGDVLDTLHLRPSRRPPQDFVVRSRPAPDSLDYQPMKPNEKPTGKKTPAQLDALGAELEGALATKPRAGARVAMPDPAPRPAARRAAAAKPPRDQSQLKPAAPRPKRQKPEPKPTPRNTSGTPKCRIFIASSACPLMSSSRSIA